MFALPRVDPEFKSLIPPLAADEREQLEQNILQARKCHDAIILWEGAEKLKAWRKAEKWGRKTYGKSIKTEN